MQMINDLKRNFITMFPFVGKEGELAHLATSIGKVDLNYYINNENMITGDPRENFDSRKTKIKDENYQSLYDQLVQEWSEAESLEPFDNAIIESPKNCLRKNRKMRLARLNEEENIVADDIDELNENDDNGQRIEQAVNGS